MKVNFLPQDHARSARRTTVGATVAFTVLAGLIAAVGAGASYRSANRGTNVFREVGNLPVITNIRQIVQGPNAITENDTTVDQRLNIMLFGIGGAGHDGSQLTDTIILASIDLKDRRVGMLSIPRDMAYPLGKGEYQKINAVNAYAEQDHPGEGAKIAANDIGAFLGVDIDHVVKIDFKGFEQFIDALGGIEIKVERGFVDPKYPTWDEKEQTISFKAGSQHMNGTRALMFVRSRHGSNGEGSDFARSRRQQLVLAAIRSKLLSIGTLSSPGKMADLWSAISSHVQTDLSVWDAIALAPLATDFDPNKIHSHVLTSDPPDGELVQTRLEHAGSLLFPKDSDWSEIRRLAANPFGDPETPKEEGAENIAAAPTVHDVRVEIKNGTLRTGFAGNVADSLKQRGFEVTGTANATRRGYQKTVIFDLNGGTKNTQLAQLKTLLDATVSAASPVVADDSKQKIVYGEGLSTETILSPTSDFLIILGESSLNFIAGSPSIR